MADYLKDLVYTTEDVITFNEGIPGFEKNKEFIIVQIPDYAPFEWLVSVDGSGLRFVIINPLLFCPDYAPDIHKEQLGSLGIEKPEDILLYAIVTLKANPQDSTANLIGPVIINKTKRCGKQIIFDNDTYTTRERIIRK